MRVNGTFVFPMLSNGVKSCMIQLLKASRNFIRSIYRARENGGLVITLEADEAKVTYAKDKLKQAGLLKYVDFRVGDALNLIEKAEEQFDFVLVDIWKDLYLPCFELFYPKLNDKAWVLADNMIFPPQSNEVTQLYQNRIRQTENFSSVLLPIGSGIELSQYELKTL